MMCSHPNARRLVGADLERNAPTMRAQLEQIFPYATYTEIDDIIHGGRFAHAWCPDCHEFMLSLVR